MKRLVAVLLALLVLPLPARANFGKHRRAAPPQVRYYYPAPVYAVPAPVLVSPPVTVEPPPILEAAPVAPPPILEAAPVEPPILEAAPVAPPPLIGPDPVALPPIGVAPAPAIPSAPPPLAVPEAAPPSAIPQMPPAVGRSARSPSRVSVFRPRQASQTVFSVHPSRHSSSVRVPGQARVTWWNLTGRSIFLEVGGQSRVVARGSSLTLDLPRSFTWRVEGEGAEVTQVPAAEQGVTITLRE